MFETPRFSAAKLATQLGLPAPTEQQVAIIEAPLSPLLVIAGAGSGKTETMAARVVWLVANGLVQPDHVLGLTFTRKAASELSTRVRSRLTQLRQRGLATVESDPVVSTYHAYAARIVAEHGLRAGFEPTARLLTEANCWLYADAIVAAYNGDMSYVEAAPSTVAAAVLSLAGQCAEHLRTPAELDQWIASFCARIEQLPCGNRRGAPPAEVAKLLARQRARAQLLPLVERYAERKASAEALDFADQLARAAVLARDHPEVAATERARYRVVLLDEYQDTSHAQLVLLQSLFGSGHCVTAVGDPCQSIYGWRGASAGNLLRFPVDFPASATEQAPTAPLTTSWRNAPKILALANEVSGPLRASAPITVPTLSPRPHIRAVGEVVCALQETIDDEAAWVAGSIAELWRERENPPTTAVLVRKRDQLDRLATALRGAGLPVEVVGLGGLLATPEIGDIVATLTVLADPGAGHALLRLLTGARWQLGPRDIRALRRRADQLSEQSESSVSRARESLVIEALDDLGSAEDYSPVGYERLIALRDELRGLRRRLDQPLPEMVAEVERALGLDIEVAVHRSGPPEMGRAQLDAFADVVMNFASSAEHPTLTAFLAYLAAAEVHEYGLSPGEVEVHPGAVQLLTMHAAKGLEWDVVAVPGMTAGVFPAEGGASPVWTQALGVLPFSLRGDVADLPDIDLSGVVDQVGAGTALEKFRDQWREYELREERRLAYVAVTRARTHLLCSGYWWDSAKRPRGPSVFLEEMHRYCTRAGTIVHWAPSPDDDACNPYTANPRTANWPISPLGDRRERWQAAADLVHHAMRHPDNPDCVGDSISSPEGIKPDRPEERILNPQPQTESEPNAWAAEARLLLAEQAARRRVDRVGVALPSHLAVSNLVTLQRDPEELAREIRRPMPRRPAPHTRRGTAFHAWLERRFGAQHLLDLDELPGAGDADAAPDEELVALQEAFQASAWADRVPTQVEVPFAMVVAGVVVRGRIDAVFASGDGWQVVDWKTGKCPTGDAAQAGAVQLAAYRLAWAELAKVPITQVSAAFHYVRENRTIHPVDLLDTAGLADLITHINS